jgi:CRP/FNR family transcriptional regulator, cyclic AMP receptor protein
MRTIDALLAEVPAFEGMASGHLELIAACASNRVFADGEYLAREGDPADTFYVIRTGSVALEIDVPQRGALVIETLHDNDLVGWSWLLAPYRTHIDVRACGTTHMIAFDGACLRGRCDADPLLGYDLLRRFAVVIVERLQATRLRLIDVYGHVRGG